MDQVKNALYSGPKLVIRQDGIKIRKGDIMIGYPEITSLTIRKARLTRGWLGLIFFGIFLDITLLYLLYLFVTNVYDMSDLHRGYIRFPRRSSGIVMGILLVLPIVISYRIARYFTRPLMLIIKWDKGEFRIKFSELGISVAELKNYLPGKVNVVAADL
jgi:hypothetical protein